MATTLVSVERYLDTSYPDGDCEYVDGQKPTRFRVPDVVLVAGPKPAGSIIPSPPHLVVEVLSPEDRAGAVQEKIDDCLGFGIPYVWVVNPQTGRGYVHATDAAREAKDGVLRAEDPAIELPLSDLLAR